MIRFLFRQNQPKRFEFKPRYYNPMKEELDARVEAIKREMELENSAYSNRELRSRMQHSWQRPTRKETIKTSNFRVIAIAGILLLIAYLLLK